MTDAHQAASALREGLADCELCPRRCRVNRLADELGVCGVGAQPIVASSGPHFGEEPVLVGRGGSGTIFFSGCNLRCVFCQNYDISHGRLGRMLDARALADIALGLEARGCENINFVTPSHVPHAVAEAVAVARDGGLDVPVVYNCGGYEKLETLRRLEGIVGIYMPDFKYADPEAARKYSGVADYPQVAEAALEEMYRQVGTLKVDARGVATGGLLVRHLVMPDDLAHSRDVIRTVARAAPGCAINVMGQYRPEGTAARHQELLGRPAIEEVRSLRRFAVELGLHRVD